VKSIKKLGLLISICLIKTIINKKISRIRPVAHKWYKDGGELFNWSASDLILRISFFNLLSCVTKQVLKYWNLAEFLSSVLNCKQRQIHATQCTHQVSLQIQHARIGRLMRSLAISTRLGGFYFFYSMTVRLCDL